MAWSSVVRYAQPSSDTCLPWHPEGIKLSPDQRSSLTYIERKSFTSW
ncbi:MAG: hypothetical protein K0S45_2061 [Nitrospira sp.]|nr:hypothetical protein [Nitrospira sp.]